MNLPDGRCEAFSNDTDDTSHWNLSTPTIVNTIRSIEEVSKTRNLNRASSKVRVNKGEMA